MTSVVRPYGIRCERCGSRHDESGLWECATCGAVLCEHQVQLDRLDVVAFNQDGFTLGDTGHRVHKVFARNPAQRVCGPCMPVAIIDGEREYPDYDDAVAYLQESKEHIEKALSRPVYPSIKDLVKVQPMTKPTVEQFFMDYKYVEQRAVELQAGSSAE